MTEIDDPVCTKLTEVIGQLEEIDAAILRREVPLCELKAVIDAANVCIALATVVRLQADLELSLLRYAQRRGG